MKNKLFFTGMLAMALTFGLILTGCPTDADDDDGGGGGNGGWLTFSDSWPPDVLTNVDFTGAFVIADGSTFTNKATLRAVATEAYCTDGFSDWINESAKKVQFHVRSPKGDVNSSSGGSDDPAWTGSGTYTVVFAVADTSSYTTTYYTKSGVSFTSGNATVTWAGFTAVPNS